MIKIIQNIKSGFSNVNEFTIELDKECTVKELIQAILTMDPSKSGSIVVNYGNKQTICGFSHGIMNTYISYPDVEKLIVERAEMRECHNSFCEQTYKIYTKEENKNENKQ